MRKYYVLYRFDGGNCHTLLVTAKNSHKARDKVNKKYLDGEIESLIKIDIEV